MPVHSTLILLFAVTVSALGFAGVFWCRCAQPGRARLGRRLFLSTLAILAGASFLGAWQPHRPMLFLGLTVASLVIAMLWEIPGDSGARRETWEPASLPGIVDSN